MNDLTRLGKVRAALNGHATAAAELRAEQAELLRRLMADGMTAPALADHLGVTRQRVYQLVHCPKIGR